MNIHNALENKHIDGTNCKNEIWWNRVSPKVVSMTATFKLRQTTVTEKLASGENRHISNFQLLEMERDVCPIAALYRCIWPYF